jgi:hypothetical protein
MTKFELDLRIPLTYPYVKFELNVLYRWGDNEWKLKISYYFSKLQLPFLKNIKQNQFD